LLHFQNGAGEWLDIDDDLVPDSGQYVRKTKQTPYLMRVARSGRRRIYPNPEDTSKYVVFGGMANVGNPVYVGNSMTWESNRGFEVRLQPRGSVVKLGIKVLRKGAPKRYTFPMQLVGLTRWGRFIFDGEEAVLEIRQPVAVDITGEVREVGLEFTGTTVHLTLDDEGLRYPIIIDPTVDRTVAAGADDVTRWGAVFSVTDPITTLGEFFGNSYNAAYRFTNITIPQGSAISSAWIQFMSSSARTGSDCDLKIRAHDHDNSSQITSASDFDARVAAATSSQVNWNNIPSWSFGEKSEDTKSPDLSGPVGDVITLRSGWASGNAINILVENNGGTDTREAAMYEHATYDPADLHIEFSEGAVTGVAVLSAESGGVLKGVLSPGLMKASLAAEGDLTVVGSVGALQLGQAAFAAESSMTAKAVYIGLGRSNLDAEGVLTSVAVRDRTAQATLGAEGAMAVRGELGGVLEGAAALSAEGVMAAIAVRTRPGQAALAANGALVAQAVFAPGVGRAALSAEGTMTVIADVGVPITEPMTNTTRELDPAHYPSGSTFEMIAQVEVSPGGTWWAYVYNVTLGVQIAGSAVFSFGPGITRKVSSPFSLASGPNLYRVQYGGIAGFTYTPHGSDIRIHAEP
jgi:hypothetical protein